MKKGRLIIFWTILFAFRGIFSLAFAQDNLNFTVPIRVQIGENEFELKIGCRENATDEFDNGIDVINPPAGFNAYAYFLIDEFPNILKEDYRKSGQEHQWSLRITNAAADSSLLFWETTDLTGEDQLFLNNSINMLFDSTTSFFGNQNIIITYQPNTSSVEKSYRETTNWSFRLYQNYPNPFNPTTTIKYQLPKSGKVTLKIYDVLGRLVRTIVDTEQAAGYYEVCWDGMDSDGNNAATGVYFCWAILGDHAFNSKIQLLR